MGLFSGNHKPAPARNPRPKGAQKGIIPRDTSWSFFEAGTTKARTPWFGSKSDKSVARGHKYMGRSR